MPKPIWVRFRRLHIQRYDLRSPIKVSTSEATCITMCLWMPVVGIAQNMPLPSSHFFEANIWGECSAWEENFKSQILKRRPSNTARKPRGDLSEIPDQPGPLRDGMDDLDVMGTARPKLGVCGVFPPWVSSPLGWQHQSYLMAPWSGGQG